MTERADQITRILQQQVSRSVANRDRLIRKAVKSACLAESMIPTDNRQDVPSEFPEVCWHLRQALIELGVLVEGSAECPLTEKWASWNSLAAYCFLQSAVWPLLGHPEGWKPWSSSEPAFNLDDLKLSDEVRALLAKHDDAAEKPKLVRRTLSSRHYPEDPDE